MTEPDTNLGAINLTDNVWRAPLFPLSLAATLGIVLDRYGGIPLSASLLSALTGLAAWLLLRQTHQGNLPLVYIGLATAAMGAAYHHWYREIYPASDIGEYAKALPQPVMVPARPSLPHQDAPVASWRRPRCRITLRHLAGRRRSEHHPVRHLPPPPFQATLQRSQLPVPVGTGLLRLQPLKQFARRTPRLGLEPAVQLLRHCCKRVRTPSQPFGLMFRSCRRPHLTFLPRGP